MTEPAAVLAIFGSTGSGKTDVAVRVARLLDTEVVNADPAQCYRGLALLTNQPTLEHDSIAPHRLVGTWELATEANVAQFAREAHRAIDSLIQQNGVVVVCGGSGLYLRAALTELGFGADAGDAPPQPQLRAVLTQLYDRAGAQTLHNWLGRLDPDAAARIHPSDAKRIVRGCEAVLQGGSVAAGSLWDTPTRHRTLVVDLRVDRPVLWERIERRTARMLAGGVIEEVAGVIGSNGHRLQDLSETARMIHGLSDCANVLTGQWDVEQARQSLVIRTRQYGKRQATWGRRWPGIVGLESTSTGPDQLATLVLRERQRDALREVAGTGKRLHPS